MAIILQMVFLNVFLQLINMFEFLSIFRGTLLPNALKKEIVKIYIFFRQMPDSLQWKL